MDSWFLRCDSFIFVWCTHMALSASVMGRQEIAGGNVLQIQVILPLGVYLFITIYSKGLVGQHLVESTWPGTRFLLSVN